MLNPKKLADIGATSRQIEIGARKSSKDKKSLLLMKVTFFSRENNLQSVYLIKESFFLSVFILFFIFTWISGFDSIFVR